MIPYCEFAGVARMPWSPLARGVLARPWTERSTLRERTDRYVKAAIRDVETETDEVIVGRVEEVAAKHGVSMACIALAWCLKKGEIPIVGLSSVERADETARNARFELSDEDAAYLEEPHRPKAISGFDGNNDWRRG